MAGMRRRRVLSDYKSEACDVEVASAYGYRTYSLPGKRVSAKLVAQALGRDPKEFAGGCEAYGRSVQCYVGGRTRVDLEQMSQTLRTAGIKHQVQEFTEGHGRLMIPVTYFKAWHWNE
jgi:hypothetical protein